MEIKILIFVAFLFLVIGIFLFKGKGLWLIAGYNTLPKEEQDKYDKNKLSKSVGSICFLVSIINFILAYIIYTK